MPKVNLDAPVNSNSQQLSLPQQHREGTYKGRSVVILEKSPYDFLAGAGPIGLTGGEYIMFAGFVSSVVSAVAVGLTTQSPITAGYTMLTCIGLSVLAKVYADRE